MLYDNKGKTFFKQHLENVSGCYEGLSSQNIFGKFLENVNLEHSGNLAKTSH